MGILNMFICMFIYFYMSTTLLDFVQTTGEHSAAKTEGTQIIEGEQATENNYTNSRPLTCSDGLKSSVLRQRNLSDAEVIRLINDIAEEGKNDSVNLHREKRKAGGKNKPLGRARGPVKKSPIKFLIEECLEDVIEWGIDLYKNEENRKVLVDLMRDFLEALERLMNADVMDIFGSPHQPYLPHLWFDQMKTSLNNTSGQIAQGKISKTSSHIAADQSDLTTEKQQTATEILLTTDVTPVKAEITKAAEGQSVTTEVLRNTETSSHVATEESILTTEKQQATTEIPPTTDVPPVRTGISKAAEGQPFTTEVPKNAEVEQVSEDYRRTTLLKSAEQGNLKAVKYFLEVKNKSIRASDNQYNSLLHLAALNGHIEVVKYLLDRGFDTHNFHKKNRFGMTPLGLSAQNGHLETVKYLTDSGADINGGGDEATPLLLAVKNGHFDTIKYLIDKGANFTFIDSYMKTPLYYAVGNGNLELVKYLLEKGANISYYYYDWRGGKHLSVLPYAAASGNLTLVKYLVEMGADISGKDYFGTTALMAAATNGNLSVVKYLVEMGAPVNGGRRSALWSAANNGHLDIVKYLIANGAEIDWEGGILSLLFAIEKGDIEFVKCLVEKGVDINALLSNLKTPLQEAIQGRKFDIAIFLVESGADITKRDSNGCTILHQAVEKGALDLVKLLVENKGVDVNIKTSYMKKTPLHFAIKSTNMDLAKYLLEKGAQVNGTYLHTAVETGNLSMVEYLVNAGADIHMKNYEGSTPLHLAAQNHYIDIVKYLVEKGANTHTADNEGETPIGRAADKCYLDIVKILTKDEPLDNEDPPEAIKKEENAEEKSQMTEYSEVTCELGKDSLQSAVELGNLDKIKCLIAKGADVNAKNDSGLTALHKAAINRPNFKSGLRIVKYLVENGADVNARSINGRRFFLEDGIGLYDKRKSGRTPLHYAAIHGRTSFSVINGRVTGGCMVGNLDTAQYLVYKGADVTARDEDGKTPLDLVRTRCNPEVLEFLSKKCGIRKP